jgi:SAM-dependent methyltransferase
MGTEEENKEKEYFARSLELEADRERLLLQEQTFDSFTIRHLETIGVNSGWKCLNVGAGYGSITDWLAQKVGNTGRVVATDIRPELHREVVFPVEVRKHDILKDELEQNHYDFICSRMLLQHLPEPERALQRMNAAVKPGGWLLIQELDNLTFPKSDIDPQADFFYRSIHKYLDLLSEAGGRGEFGRKVRYFLEQIGYDDIGNEGHTFLVRGGEPWAMATITNAKLIWKRLINTRLVIEEEIKETADEIERLLSNPSFQFVSAPLFSAWGRKPKK